MHRPICAPFLLVLPLLLAVTGCDLLSGPLADETVVSGEDRNARTDFAIVVQTHAQGHTAPLVFEATGAIVDRGQADGNPWTEGEVWVGHRTFMSPRGTFLLLIEARPTTAAADTLARGTFHLVRGTAAHAGLAGRGTFTLLERHTGARTERYTGRLCAEGGEAPCLRAL